MGYKYVNGDILPLTLLASDPIVTIEERIINLFIKKIYEQTIDLIDESLFDETFKLMVSAIESGYGEIEYGVTDPKLIKQLKTNTATFAAFKNHAQIVEIQQLLTVDEKIRPWKEFKKLALEISDKYNKRWLQTEYSHAVQSSRMARKWDDFDRDKDLYPNLKYVTAGDERVRADHAVLDGVVYPIDDEFWDTYMPPNGWGCRCSVQQTDDEVVEATGVPEMPKMFQNNPGKTGKLFDDNHEYYKTDNKDEINEWVKNKLDE